MVASLLRVLHSGMQNERLQPQEQPKTTFFQKIFRPSGRFTTQWHRLDFNSPPQFGQQAVAVLPRKGHLLSRLYLITNYPTPPISNVQTTITTSNVPVYGYTYITKTFSSNILLTNNLESSTDTSPAASISLPTDFYAASNTAINIQWGVAGYPNNYVSDSINLIFTLTDNIQTTIDNVEYNVLSTPQTPSFRTIHNFDLTNNQNQLLKLYISPNGDPLNISNIQFSVQFSYTAQSNIIMPFSNTIITTSNTITYPSWTNSVGHAIIQSAELQIGGARVDRIDGNLMELLDEFNTPLEKVPVVNRLIGRHDSNYNSTPTPTYSSNLRITSNVIAPTQIQLTSNITLNTYNNYKNSFGLPLSTATPLPFFFSRGDAAAALPVDAIQADEIRLQFQFRPFSSLFYYSNAIVASNAVGTAEGSAFSLPQQQPQQQLGDTYLLAEYIYLDAPEANRFRIADITLPITQHYMLPTVDTLGLPNTQIQIAAPNPVRDIFFFCQPWLAPAYNAHFLATKYISSNAAATIPWWPDAQGLNPLYPEPLKPAFYPDTYNSEPLQSLSLVYEGRLVKFSTENTALFRQILPSLEQKKAPWLNRYYYNIPLGLQHGLMPRTTPTGFANYDVITRRELQLTFPIDQNGLTPRLWIRPYVETYNILRIYGGRAGTLFGY